MTINFTEDQLKVISALKKKGEYKLALNVIESIIREQKKNFFF